MTDKDRELAETLQQLREKVRVYTQKQRASYSILCFQEREKQSVIERLTRRDADLSEAQQHLRQNVGVEFFLMW